MKKIKCDVLIIGGGPGGISAASKVAMAGKKTVIINDGPLMGYGIEGAFRSKAGFEITREYLHAKLRRHVFGDLAPLNIESLQQGIDKSAASLTRMLERRLERLHIDVVQGRGCFIDPYTVAVGDVQYRAENIVIATGTRPRVLPGMDIDGRRVLSSDEVNELSFTPKSILILGAGVIGCEFASMFNVVGTDVHLVDTQSVIMSNEDPDLSHFVATAFERRGIKVIPSSRYKSMEVLKNTVRTQLSTGEIETESVLLAIGRIPCSDTLNIEVSGVALDKRGYIPIGADTRTSVPHIFAVGDIGNRDVPSDLSLVHVAEAEGRCAGAHILGDQYRQSMNHIPYIIFTVPMLAGAGVNETYAREKYGDIRVGKYPYARNHRAHAIQPAAGFVKLIVGPEGDDRILGVRVVGPEADSIVSAASIIIERELPYTYLIESIFPHPSLLECLQGAAHIISGDILHYEEGEEIDFTSIDIEGM
ncbi:MAG: NAD(P)/FAD-dependent oxidoreductase [Spongiibacteraceae bacterium]|nr:NAD(P)/FAD-dependent oxidoreductase [Spongiibacteraceae bacterium]